MKNISLPKAFPPASLLSVTCYHFVALVTTNLLLINGFLPFLEFHINGIMQYIVFHIWLPSPIRC